MGHSCPVVTSPHLYSPRCASRHRTMLMEFTSLERSICLVFTNLDYYCCALRSTIPSLTLIAYKLFNDTPTVLYHTTTRTRTSNHTIITTHPHQDRIPQTTLPSSSQPLFVHYNQLPTPHPHHLIRCLRFRKISTSYGKDTLAGCV